ncbi:MAG: phosphatidylserine decarboxylase family protein [Planctomycetes bacterium]|nr:phosphatidylserine decarboxylase family protein [Planctomycetota bacterium]
MDPQLTDIQPGGGVVKELELAWGAVRRWYLRTFRKGYVARMQALRHGDQNRCPHDVLDPRDLKYYRNQNGYWWDEKDDPFRWRDRLPFARAGLAELVLLGGLSFALAAWAGAVASTASGLMAAILWPVCGTLTGVGLLIVWFFRDPRREIPREPGQVVAPADGKVVSIERIDENQFVGGPAVVIGIFLSIFNVHINRTPTACRVIGLRYRRGKFLNALRPESARENEQLAVRLEENEPPYRRMIVRQIAGAVARRIVCWVKPGDVLARGEPFGLIKLGSRTELVLPDEPGLRICVRAGDAVRAGQSVLAVYEKTDESVASDRESENGQGRA